MATTEPQASLRIGELSRRLGVTDHALRAWERRYGLLRPVRTTGGFRLYSEADLKRVIRMQAHLARGLSTAEAARAAIEEDATEEEAAFAAHDPGSRDLGGTVAEAMHALTLALDEFDEPAAQAVIDRLLSTLTVETVLRRVLLPYLRDLGERWESGTLSIAQEHFASNIIRGRLSSMARGWGNGGGPRVLLACAPGELHDIGLLAFGIVLNRRGWRVQYFGPDTPINELVHVASARRTDLIVLVGSTSRRLDDARQGLTRLARIAPLAIAGSGATEAIAHKVGAQLLVDDPVTAAESTASTR